MLLTCREVGPNQCKAPSPKELPGLHSVALSSNLPFWLEAIASRLEAIGIRLEAVPSRLEAIAFGREENAEALFQGTSLPCSCGGASAVSARSGAP